MKVPKGTILLISNGEYSDYYANGIFKVKEDIDTNQLVIEYLKLKPEELTQYSGNFDGFLVWLNNKDLLEEIKYSEFHIGSYGCYEIEEKRVDNISKEKLKEYFGEGFRFKRHRGAEDTVL